jgi:hypothetical protein
VGSRSPARPSTVVVAHTSAQTSPGDSQTPLREGKARLRKDLGEELDSIFGEEVCMSTVQQSYRDSILRNPSKC